jgi:outer membrane protein TolC
VRGLIPLAILLAATPASAQLTFEQAVRTAVEKNERSAIAGRTRDAADARVAQARSLFLPSVNLTGTYTRQPERSALNSDGNQVVVQPPNAVTASGSLALTLFDARSIPLYKTALRDREAAGFSTRNDVRLLGFDTANAYLLALGNQQVVAAAQRRVEHADTVLGLARGRFDAQLARSSDVTRAELEHASAATALTAAGALLDDAYLALGFLVGAGVSGPLDEPTPLFDAAGRPPEADAALVQAARARRLDLTASQRRTEALDQLALEPLMRYLPNLSLLGNGRVTNETGSSGEELDWSISLVLSWQLFDGGLGFAERRSRLADADVQRLRTQSLDRQVALDVATARVRLDAARKGLSESEAARVAAEKNQREVTELYRQGLAGALEVADAGVSLFDAEVNAIRARYTLAQAYLDLRAAVGLDALGETP